MKSELDDPLNPIVAWQWQNKQCTFVKQKFMNFRRDVHQAVGFYAQKSCARKEDTFVWFINPKPPVTCAGFGTLIGDVVKAQGIELPWNLDNGLGLVEEEGKFYQLKKTGASSWATVEDGDDPRAAHLAKGVSATQCCAECTGDPSCSAWQFKETDSVCIKVHGRTLLDHPDVRQLDMRSWAETRNQNGVGFLYHRPAPELVASPPPSPASVPTEEEPAQCSSFAKIATKGKTLLAGDVTPSRSRTDRTQTILYRNVFSWEGCCEVASRMACTENPVVMYQLVGTTCVLKRKESVSGLVRERATQIANVVVPCDDCESDEYISDYIFYSETPTCRNEGGTLSPCATNGREGLAEGGVCTGNDQETCYFDINCKAGGLGCNAGGYESCRFCGFDFSSTGGTDYSSVTCPGSVPEPVTLTTVAVPDTCPSVCTGNPEETCHYDASCDDPYHPEHMGGLGCNAGGRGQRCRFCGFTNAGGVTYPPCPDSGVLVDSAEDAVTEEQAETGQGSTMSGSSVSTVEVEVEGDVDGTPKYVLLSENERCETRGYQTIMSAVECGEAAAALGYEDADGGVSAGTYFDRPYGCTWHRFGNVEFWEVGSSRTLGCTHQGYAGCFCRNPNPIEAACTSAVGANCVMTDVTPDLTCPSSTTRRRLQSPQTITTMTLTVTQDASTPNNQGYAVLNDPTVLAQSLQAAAGGSQVMAGNPTYSTTLIINTPGNLTAAQQEAHENFVADMLAASVTSFSTAIANNRVALAPVKSPPSPPCLNCGDVKYSSTIDGWVIAVICVCITVACLGIVGLVLFVRFKDQQRKKDALEKQAASHSDGVTLNAVPKAVEVSGAAVQSDKV